MPKEKIAFTSGLIEPFGEFFNLILTKDGKVVYRATIEEADVTALLEKYPNKISRTEPCFAGNSGQVKNLLEQVAALQGMKHVSGKTWRGKYGSEFTMTPFGFEIKKTI